MTKEERALLLRQRAAIEMLSRAADGLYQALTGLFVAAEIVAPGEFRKVEAARAEKDAERARKRALAKQGRARKDGRTNG